MWNIAGFQMPGYDLDMYPGDHFPHHFHLSCDEFDVRILIGDRMWMELSGTRRFGGRTPGKSGSR